ncbi:MAG: hypothetical protein JOY90_36270 [Bradyrhizobium sp.]|uniref:hypothetical protein n=1 Tax=Bradyrhizobium sp. TaxID=376 RepID=UPI001D8E3B75|nr:hypothetical protein [Bradyrhizobium sp.]MBV9565868.1 hypothetical protein [Bradyrhizobium sp.]
MGRKLDIAFWNYDRGRALRDGDVKVEGVDATFHSGRIVVDIFEAMVKSHAYDVSELGVTYFLRTLELNDPPFLAIPVFLVRSFRHSAIYINKTKGIEGPQDLNGRRIGELALYGHDAGVMPKGMLSDEFGFKPEKCRWIIGGIDFPLKPIDWLPKPIPQGVDVTYAKGDVDLGEMLEAGEIDALISADTPKCVLEKRPTVGRLFEDYETIERDYFRRTGIFPIMHLMVIRKELAKETELVRAVYKAFCEAKDFIIKQLVQGMTFNNMTLMIPWLTNQISRDRELLGDDWWPYGISANRKSLDTYLRYHHEQGLSKQRLTIEDVFVPTLLDT